ncbi:hypothetical protein ROSA5918_17415 [Roseateles saccharophilus]|uniref:Uncharacterized protein n=2 Tax=Roseateles saccharophilus TaxID=304 RepID=A0A4R3V1P0_ROSSA|nr:hypothetical protein EV671_101124 [Roseateles saccharophilus]
MRRCRSRTTRKAAYGCVGLIIVAVGACYLDVSFTSTVANFAFASAAYLAYCFLAICTWSFKWLPLRVLALAVTAIPVAAGYVLGTVGMLGLMFIVGDYANPPIQTTNTAADLECRTTGWGMVATDSGYTVHLYKHWPAFPLIEREVARVVVNETNPGAGPTSASCDDVLAKR